MEDKEIFEVLKIILNRIDGEGLLWRLEGSANLRVQGVDTKVNDLDITTNTGNYKKFKSILKDFIVEEKYTKEKNMQSIVCDINNSEVEILYYVKILDIKLYLEHPKVSNNKRKKLFDNDNEKIMLDKVKIINWRGLKIPVLPLEYALKFYESIGKEEKVNLIRRFLSEHNN